MRRRDTHQVRTFFVRPKEKVTIQCVVDSNNASANFRSARRSDAIRASKRKIEFEMPKEGTGMKVIELDVAFGGQWNKLHLDRAGIDVHVRGTKGSRFTHHIVPGPKLGRWTYRMVAADPGRTLHFCPEIGCKSRMLPVTFVAGESVCPSCRGSRMIPVKVPV